jgi:aminoglycoside 3-N-acetyltransferase
MSEQRHVKRENSAVPRAESPNIWESLAADPRALSVTRGLTLLVHASLSTLGWVAGGPVPVIQALMDVVTPEATLVMSA